MPNPWVPDGCYDGPRQVDENRPRARPGEGARRTAAPLANIAVVPPEYAVWLEDMVTREIRKLTFGTFIGVSIDTTMKSGAGSMRVGGPAYLYLHDGLMLYSESPRGSVIYPPPEVTISFTGGILSYTPPGG